MARRTMALALGLIAAAPLWAAPLSAAAPDGTSDTRYCMRIDPPTGSRIEPVVCWTREQWTDQGVDVDRNWDRDGVRTVG